MSRIQAVEVHVDSWDQARSFGQRLAAAFIFRGQNNSSWPLSTRLERDIEAAGGASANRTGAESRILKAFTKRVRLYSSVPPRNDLEALGLLQHYGAPTRLLDFTRSFYIAAFFAINGASTNCAVFAVNTKNLVLGIDSILKTDYGNLPFDECNDVLRETALAGLREDLPKTGFRLKSGEITINETKIPTPMLVLPVELDQLHERLSIQQGTFLFQMNLFGTFEENLANTLGLSQNLTLKRIPVDDCFDFPEAQYDLVKIVMPQTVQEEGFWDLDDMNVNSQSLFPGLDGFARSLSKYCRTRSFVKPKTGDESD